MGFEPGHIGVFDLGSDGSIATDFTRGAWSTYSCSLGNSGSSRSWNAQASTFYFGFGWYAVGSSVSKTLVRFSSPTGTDNVTLQTNGGSFLQVVNSGVAVLATGSIALTPDTWHYIQGKLVISNTGTYETFIDGVADLSGSGDTRNDATTANCQRWIFGGSGAGGSRIDDCYVNDTTGGVNDGYSGDIRIGAYIVNADGDSSGFTLSTGTSHFAVVDERPPNDDTDYAYDSGTTAKDLMNIPNASAVDEIQAVTHWLRAKKTDAGAKNVAHMVKSGGTEYTSADVALSTSYAYYSEIYDTDPTDSAAWTTTKFNAMQVGFKSR